MPSPRAVLNDITNLGLDPNKKYSSLGKSGNLKPADPSKISLEKKEIKKEVKQLVEEVVQTDEVTEQLTQEEVVENLPEPVIQPETTVVTAEKKKGKFAKKKSNNN